MIVDDEIKTACLIANGESSFVAEPAARAPQEGI
jgi:hypothetical protein